MSTVLSFLSWFFFHFPIKKLFCVLILKDAAVVITAIIIDNKKFTKLKWNCQTSAGNLFLVEPWICCRQATAAQLISGSFKTAYKCRQRQRQTMRIKFLPTPPKSHRFIGKQIWVCTSKFISTNTHHRRKQEKTKFCFPRDANFWTTYFFSIFHLSCHDFNLLFLKVFSYLHSGYFLVMLMLVAVIRGSKVVWLPSDLLEDLKHNNNRSSSFSSSSSQSCRTSRILLEHHLLTGTERAQTLINANVKWNEPHWMCMHELSLPFHPLLLLSVFLKLSLQ